MSTLKLDELVLGQKLSFKRTATDTYKLSRTDLSNNVVDEITIDSTGVNIPRLKILPDTLNAIFLTLPINYSVLNVSTPAKKDYLADGTTLVGQLFFNLVSEVSAKTDSTYGAFRPDVLQARYFVTNVGVSQTFYVPRGSLYLSGSAIVENVYIGDLAFVNATALLGGIDIIYFSGTFESYTKINATSTRVVVSKLAPDGFYTGGTFTKGTISVYDKLVFSNGSISTYDLVTAIAAGTTPVLNTAETTPTVIPPTAYTIDIPKLDSSLLPLDGGLAYRASWPGLFAKIGTFYGAGDGVTTFQLPMVDNTTLDVNGTTPIPGGGAYGVRAFIKGF
jgi:hypothetical protein